MAYRLIITAEAHQEEADAYNYYEDIRSGLGEELLTVLNSYYERLKENPFHYSYIGTSKTLRDVKVDRFPYLLVYFVSGDTVYIISVRHASRKPIM